MNSSRIARKEEQPWNVVYGVERWLLRVGRSGSEGIWRLRSESSSKSINYTTKPCSLSTNKPARSGRRRLSMTSRYIFDRSIVISLGISSQVDRLTSRSFFDRSIALPLRISSSQICIPKSQKSGPEFRRPASDQI